MSKQNILRGIKYGIAAGMVSTIVTDIVSLVIFAIMGESLWSFFALIGRSFLMLIGADAAYPVWQGLALHYSIGILTGLVLSLLTQEVPRLQFTSYRKGILSGIIITQVEGNALYYLMSIIMRIPQTEMVMIYAIGFILHLMWGTCLGLMITYGQQHMVPAQNRCVAQ